MMELQKYQQNNILKQFQNLETKEDLLNLLNYAKIIMYGDKAHLFELRQLNYYSNPNVNQSRYKTFKIRKKSGAVRVIHAPVNGLKAIQRALNLVLHCIFKPHPSAMGFAIGKSIKDNASLHAGNYYVYNIDLKDFFFSIDQARVWKCFQLKPFNLGNHFSDNVKYDVVNILSAICCTPIEVERQDEDKSIEKILKNVVPQGAPTSPIVTNIVCQRLDYLLTSVAKRFGLKYSRYADDITFSSLHNVYQSNGLFIQELERVIKNQGFLINEAKTRLQKQGTRQQVTGLVVNKEVNIQASYVKKIRSWLYLWENYGYEKAYQFFLNDYINDKGHVKKNIPKMDKIIGGKLCFLKMIKGADNELYKKLQKRFDLLSKYKKEQIYIDKIITSWIQKGFVVTFNNYGISPGINDPSDFVTSLINDKHSSPNQKKQLTDLLGHELNKAVANIKDTKNEKEINDDGGKIGSLKKDNINMPKNVADFMSLFDDPKGLKYLTHDFDESEEVFDIETFLSNAHKIFEENTKPGRLSIPTSLWAVVNEFAFAKNPNWNKGCKEGWSKPEVIAWSKKEKKHLKRNLAFSKIIESFRKLTRIEAPELKYLVKDVLIEKLGDKYDECEIEIKDCEKADFYTHVGFFKEALKLLLDGCYKRIAESNKISIRYERRTKDGYRERIVKISHINSFPLKPIDDFLEDIKHGKGELADVQSKLRGYCTWSIETLWDNKPIRVNILGGKQEIEELKDTKNNPIGFTHTLTFYQK